MTKDETGSPASQFSASRHLPFLNRQSSIVNRQSIRAGLLVLSTLLGLPVLAQESRQALDRVRTEIPYRDGTVVLVSEFQEKITKTRYRATGHVEISFQDILMTSEQVEYDEESRKGVSKGTTRFSQNKQWLTCSRAEFDFADETGTFYDASGFSDQEFLIRGRTIYKTGHDTYRIDSGFMTACPDKVPKWAFGMSKASIRVDHTARLRHMVFKLKGIPVFYTPYLVVPMEKKERSSGILFPHTGTSTSKGRVFNEGYFQTLGRSADVAVYGDYFSLRGLGVGAIFRARPNPQTRLYVLAYGIRDRLGQGGAHLLTDAESHFGDGYRAVANVNITSNFRFRQAFSDSFRSATIPQERGIVFLTRNLGSISTNFSFNREEVRFPVRSLVIRKFPSIEFFSLGRPLGSSPFILQLRLAAEGISRVDSVLATPNLVQRLDAFPRLTVRLPAFKGFSLIPTIGLRQTYYSSRIEEQPTPHVVSKALNRQYADIEVDLRTPTLEKNYHTAFLGPFKHVVEPVATYRWITGIDRLHETIRFDEEDVTADTNEMEYGIVNRIFKSRESTPGARQQFEFLSLRLTQKYYFDPDFGGSFRRGEPNTFYPLYTITGFFLTEIQRSLVPMSMVLRVTPRPNITYDVRTDYDAKLQAFRDTSVSTLWQREKLFATGTYFKTNGLEKGALESHHIQGQFGYGSPLRGFSASVSLSYNIRTSQLLNSHSRLTYGWDCCGLAMEFQQFNLGLRTESRFNFSFTLKGIGSFGNLKRPESLF